MIVEERLAVPPKVESDHGDFIKPELDFVCSGCGYSIHEEYILKVRLFSFFLSMKY